MLVVIPLCLAIASPSWAQDSSIEKYDADSMFGEAHQSRISELARRTEEKLNCFLQFDQILASNWTARLDLTGNSDVVNRFSDDDQKKKNVSRARGLADNIRSCMGKIINRMKNPTIEKCMKGLVNSEIVTENFISSPELFDDSLPLPFITFLNIHELVRLLLSNRTSNELSPEEMTVYQVANGYLTQDSTDQDKVFVIDQACEWKNLATLQKHEDDLENQLKEFTVQVIRSISLQVANAVLIAKDLKPGRWLSVYRSWVPIRMKNIKELKTIIDDDLRAGEYTSEHLCKYATILASYFAEEEIKTLVPRDISTLHLTISDIQAKISPKEESLCTNSRAAKCSRFREMGKSYGQDLHCVESFGELLSNHFLHSIIEKYVDAKTVLTYPEKVCKKTAPFESLVVRYCRCVGSFCTHRDVGKIKADTYNFDPTTAVVTRV